MGPKSKHKVNLLVICILCNVIQFFLCLCFYYDPSHEVRWGIFHLWYNVNVQKVLNPLDFWIWDVFTWTILAHIWKLGNAKFGLEIFKNPTHIMQLFWRTILSYLVQLSVFNYVYTSWPHMSHRVLQTQTQTQRHTDAPQVWWTSVKMRIWNHLWLPGVRRNLHWANE
jgi:hypothetical protein